MMKYVNFNLIILAFLGFTQEVNSDSCQTEEVSCISPDHRNLGPILKGLKIKMCQKSVDEVCFAMQPVNWSLEQLIKECHAWFPNDCTQAAPCTLQWKGKEKACPIMAK